MLNFVKENTLTVEMNGNGTEHMTSINRDESIPILTIDKTMFKKLLPGINYTISISTQVNGTIIAKTKSDNIRFGLDLD